MTITINGLSKQRFNDMIRNLDLDLSSENIRTRRETINVSGDTVSDMYGISFTDPYDLSLKFAEQSVIITRVGVIPSYSLRVYDYDNIFII